jgi:ABC-2 type transport system permease protein
MISPILKNEWRMLARDRAVVAMALLVVVLTTWGVMAGASTARRTRATVDEMRTAERQQFGAWKGELIHDSDAKGANAWEPSYRGTTAVLPVEPTAALAIGQSDLLPMQIGISLTNNQRNPADRYGYENPRHLATGLVDLPFVVIYLLPLLIIGIAYNTLSSERERGTLPLVGSYPVSLRSVVLRRISQQCGVVILLTLVTIAAALALAAPEAWSRPAQVGLALGVTAAYAMFWAALAALVNTFRFRSAANAMLLIGAWLVIVVIAPWLLQLVARAAHPAPARIEVVTASREGGLDYARHYNALRDSWLQRYPEHRSDASAQFFFPAAFLLLQAEMDRRAGVVEARIDDALSAQQRLVDRFGWLSPAIAVREALTRLAGTHPERFATFRAQANEFHQQWRAHFGRKLLRKEAMTAEDYDRIPTFAFRPEAEGEILQRAFAGLAGVLALTFAFGLAAARRLETRVISDAPAGEHRRDVAVEPV